MYDVLDVSRYTINYSNDKNFPISNLKLQKLLYFIQAYFLISKDDVCFKDPIEAWDFGPVVRRAYIEYKKYGSSNIPKIDSYYKIDHENIWNLKTVKFNEDSIDNEDKKLIINVVENFSDYSATDLVRLTHNQDPWKKAYKPGMKNIISTESIKSFFND